MRTCSSRFAGIVFAAAMVLVPAVQAGRSCTPQKMTGRVIECGLAMAEKTMKALDASGERVVLLARSGQDLSKYGLHYSHFGFAYQQPDGQGGHQWRVVHKLNFCGTAEAQIFRQGLGEFFLDDPWRYDATWLAPNPEIQERLLPLLRDDAKVLLMHAKAYSMVSYPWSSKYQQSN